MKFLATPGTPTHDKILVLREEMKAADKAAGDFVRAQGWEPIVLMPSGRVAGGLAGIQFPECPKDWRHFWTDNGRKFYWPIRGRKSTRELLAQMEALPVIGYGRYNKAVGIDSVWSKYGMCDGPDGSFLLDISESMEHDAPDLEEITNARYKELKEAAKS